MDFTRKAILFSNGINTKEPVALTFSSIVSRDRVRLALLIADLNDLDMMAYDIGNAYLNEPRKAEIWFKAGTECGEHWGKVMILVLALYGLKTSGASRQSIFKDFFENNLNLK